MFTDLLLLEVPTKYVRLVRDTLNNFKVVVRISGKLTNAFNINVAVRQGDTLSTILCNVTMKAIVRELKISGYRGIKTTQICAYTNMQ